MKTHWKILLWLLAGALVGGAFQYWLEATPDPRISVEDASGGVRVTRTGSKVNLGTGDVVTGLVFGKGGDDEKTVPTPTAEAYRSAIASANNGDIVWHERGEDRAIPITLSMTADSPRARWIKPFAFLADIFLRLLKMLIVPIILTSIITGVVGVGTGSDLRRLGLKTFAYYFATSMLAIVVGLLLVNMIRPGDGAALGLEPNTGFDEIQETSFIDVLIRMVPENVFAAFGDNINMLQVIFFALLFGYFILKTDEPHRGTMKAFFEAAFEVMMKLAQFVLALIPYGVFCLLVKVVGQTGFSVFKPLLVYMATVAAALLTHTLITLPLILKFVAGINPLRWMKAMAPAIMTAFSTSSSSMTLPVSMETVEKRGKVSSRITSFVQPLGATINMDGTALYECIGVIFLAQYYASVGGEPLTLSAQLLVVVMALLASVGAAGIPSAGLIMMLTILSALKLPVEGAALLLAVDRPLDMLRTCTNVFSDTCGAAVVARSEGEDGPLTAGEI